VAAVRGVRPRQARAQPRPRGVAARPDPQLALLHARDVYTRRNEGVSIWVVKSSDITASSPDEKDPLFAPSGDKVYRHPTFYSIPDDVPHM
jgi:ring-1,2-phenylacetyl-CoA epoxidase subunit PaaB